MEKITIASLEIDYKDLLKAQADLADGMRATKENTSELEAAQKKLREEGRAGTAQYDSNQKAIEQNKVVLAGLTTEYKNNEKVLVSSVAAQGQQLGTIQRLDAENTKLRANLRGLNLETEDGKKKQKEYISQINKNTEYIRENSDAAVQQKMNIGNYKSALDLLPPSLQKGAQGFKVIGNAAKMFLANPIVLVVAGIVAAFAGLIAIFKKFDPLVEKLEQGMAALGAIFKVVQTSIIGLFTGQKGHNESMKEAIKLATDLKKAEQDLEDMNKILIVSQAKSKRQIDELLLQSKDRTKSEEERQKLIDKALAIEEEQYQERKKIADKEVEIAMGKIISGRNLTDEQKKQLEEQGVAYAIQLQKTKAITDDEVQILADALAKQENILDEDIMIREKAMNRRNVLAEKQEAEEEKAAEASSARSEKEKQELEERTAALQAYYDSVVKQQEDALQKEIDLQLKKNEELQRLDDERTRAEIDDYLLTQEYLQSAMLLDLENEKQLKLMSMTDTFEQEKFMLKQEYDAEMANAKKIGADTVLIEKKYAVIEKQIEKEKQRAKAQVISDFVGSLSSLFGEETALGKAAAITQTVINTYMGAMAAFAQTPGPVYIKLAAAGTAVATGVVALRNILKAGKGGSGADANVSGVSGSVSGVTNSESSSAIPVSTTFQSGQQTQTVLVIEDYQKVSNNQIRVREAAEL